MEQNERRIIIMSGVALASFIVMAILFSWDTAISYNFIFFGIVAAAVPYSLYMFFKFKKIRAYEEEFPSFLRDITESQRAGLSTVQAIKTAAKSDYGRLTPEIRKIDNQLSWNIPMEKVLANFSERMKDSRIIVRSIMIIEQANKSGGSIEDTMASLANNIEMIKDVQSEKSTLLNQQVMMMYAIFFIFLGITIALVKFLIPLVQIPATTSDLGVVQSFNPNPCAPCIYGGGSECISCNALSATSSAFGFGQKEDPSAYYKSLFFIMIVVQGFFSGLIAGQIGSDSVIAGIKHSLVMLVSGVFIFILSVRMGII